MTILSRGALSSRHGADGAAFSRSITIAVAEPLKRKGPRSFLLELGLVPTEPEQARAFIQRRVAFYVGTCLLFWIVIGIIKALLAPRVFGRDPVPGAWLSQVALGAAVASMWVALRSVDFPLTWVRVADAFVTLLQVTSVAVGQGLFLSPGYRPDLLTLLACAHLLVLRAAIIPSPPWFAALLAVLAWPPIAYGAFRAYVPAQSVFPHLMGQMVFVSVWCWFAVVSTSLTSLVMYGLREKVRAAMELGQYTLEGKIGEGGMGVVYRARHVLLRRPTAVKLLLDSRAGTAAVARFEREVQLTSKLSHPNIVAVYDFGRAPNGEFYYAMEYLDGIDLERLVVEDGPQPAARVVHILRQAADALADAHGVGLIHRDVKPANLILCERARQPDLLKVVDFGLVRETGGGSDPALSDVRVLAGTPMYMSPEAIVSPERVDGRSDVYALGNVAYFLLTGRPTFEANTLVEICAHHLHTPPTPPSVHAAVDASLEAIVLSCLEKDPANRPTSAELFLRLGACEVGSWGPQDAARWWSDRGQALRAKRASTHDTPRTLAVDPDRRERS